MLGNTMDGLAFRRFPAQQTARPPGTSNCNPLPRRTEQTSSDIQAHQMKREENYVKTFCLILSSWKFHIKFWCKCGDSLKFSFFRALALPFRVLLVVDQWRGFCSALHSSIRQARLAADERPVCWWRQACSIDRTIMHTRWALLILQSNAAY